MSANDPSQRKRRRARKPLDSALLEDLALRYVARYATSSAKLARYLQRKLRERGWEGQGDPGVAALVERYGELGYVDDAAYARMRGGELLRRGYGARRVAQALGEAGIAEDIRQSAAPGEAESRRAAVALARRRRFGPFFGEDLDRDRREKQIAAILRAGHGFDAARAVVDAASEAALAEWVAEAEQEETG